MCSGKESGQLTNCDWVTTHSQGYLYAAVQHDNSQAMNLSLNPSFLISAGEAGSFYNVIQDVNHQVTVSISGTLGRSM